MARLLLSTLLLLLFLLYGGCRHDATRHNSLPEINDEPSDITSRAWAWADSLTSEMTLAQQAAQLLMPAIYTQADEYSIRQISGYVNDIEAGGILLLKGDALSASIIADTIYSLGARKRVFPGMFIAMDAETGLGMRFSDAPVFPWNSRISEEADEQTFYDYGREIGRECRITGINMILGPVIDVDRGTDRNGVMRFRSLGTDHNRVASLGEAYGKGIESQKVISVGKHFPGHGATSLDTHKVLAGLDIDGEELDSVDLEPFRHFSQNGLSGIMVGHLWAEALDSVRRPASFSPVIIKEVLKKKLGFEGLILVDAVVMGGAHGYRGADAIAAGADIIIAPTDTRRELADILQAVSDGKLTLNEITDRCRRVLFYKYLFDIPFNIRKESGIANEDVSESLYLDAGEVIERLR